MMSDRLRRLLYISIYPVVFAGAGLYLLLWGMQALQTANAANSWPSTKAEIEKSFFTEHEHDDGTTYHVQIVYRYTVNGDDYQNDSIYAGYAAGTDKQEALATVNRYRVGESVDVMYDPANPRNAVLQRGVGMTAYVSVIVSMPLLWIGFGLLRSLPSEWMNP